MDRASKALRNLEYQPFVSGGETYWLREPASSRDVLEVEVHTASHLLVGGRVSAMHLARLTRWCARHVVDGPVGPDEMHEHLDEHLDMDGLMEMKAEIVALGGLPESTISQIREMYHTIHSGGCECPVCEGGERYDSAGPGPRREMEAMCMYAKIDAVTIGVVNLSHGFESTDILAAPWWAYQIEAAKRAGKASAYTERSRKDNHADVDNIMRGRK